MQFGLKTITGPYCYAVALQHGFDLANLHPRILNFLFCSVKWSKVLSVLTVDHTKNNNNKTGIVLVSFRTCGFLKLFLFAISKTPDTFQC